VAAVLFFPAYLFWNASIQRSASALPKCGLAPSFEAADQSGNPIGTASLMGRIWVADFVRFENPDHGELLSSKFVELDQNFQRNDELALVSFAIGDSSQDQLKSYAQRHEATGYWRLVRRSDSSSSEFLRQWASATADCRADLPIDRLFVLIDREGAIRGVYDGTAPEVVQKVLIDVGSLLRDRPK
jgi:protein SCO1